MTQGEAERIRIRFGFAAAVKLSQDEADVFAEGLPPKSKTLFWEDRSKEEEEPKKKGRRWKKKKSND